MLVVIHNLQNPTHLENQDLVYQLDPIPERIVEQMHQFLHLQDWLSRLLIQ